jgi:tetratricopeptide (TPR) repeat protein
MSKIRMVSIILLCLMVTTIVGGQETSPLTFSVTPGADIPLGPKASDGSDLYSFGASAALEGQYSFSSAKGLFAEALLGFSVISTHSYKEPPPALSLISLGAGAGYRLNLSPKIEVRISLDGGYSMGIFEGNVGGAPFISAQSRLLYALSPAVDLGIGAAYKHNFDLYNGIGAFLGASFNLGAGQKRSKIDIIDSHFDPVFPVFYQYYNDNPLGSISIKNLEKGTVKDVKISFNVQQYMEKPKLCAHIREMKKDEELQVPLLALFKDSILEITEGSKITAEILIEYSYLDSVFKGESTATIQLYHRNAMTWDDDRKAASFVTAKDPEILRFSKNVAGQVRKNSSQVVDTQFCSAIGLFEALGLYGISYVVDPSTPYAELSQNKFSLDFLQFPIQTMSYKAGDCDDLSILYCALLESVGIGTAFITIPGHIFMAFRLDIDPGESKQLFSSSKDLILQGDQIWIPVEITMIQDGFLEAWKMGAKEWREHFMAGTASIYPIQDAWKTYAPVGMLDPNARIAEISMSQFDDVYVTAIDRFVEDEIGERVRALTERIQSGPNSEKLMNKLGVLYARFGLYDRARVEFERAAAAQHLPAYINLGNLAFIQKDNNEARKNFKEVLRIDPNNLAALVGLAKADYESENYGSVKNLYAQIEVLNPETAARFSYLVSSITDTSRAAAVQQREAVFWSDPE